MPTQGYPSSAGPGDHTRRAHAFWCMLFEPARPQWYVVDDGRGGPDTALRIVTADLAVGAGWPKRSGIARS
jgi:hypothetical protein